MFSWGDYIAQVWDLWYADPNGILFVADLRERKKNNGDKKKSNSPIAVSHVAICPGKERIWLEGIRVHPSYRRSKVATHIIREMLQYGKKQGAKEASAIVATNNIASQLMLKKNGFKIISRWQYYSVSYKINCISRRRIDTRIASLKDVDNIWDYLRSSKIYKLSGRRYVSAWRWYLLDYNTLADFVKEQRLIITGYPFTDGVAIINKSGYWQRRGVFQIIYLDSSSKVKLQNLVSYVTSLSMISTNRNYSDHSKQFKRLQILAYHNEHVSSVMKNFNVEESEQFFLYARSL